MNLYWINSRINSIGSQNDEYEFKFCLEKHCYKTRMVDNYMDALVLG